MSRLERGAVAGRVVAALIVLAALGGCASAEQKAQRYEARADQQMAMNDYFGAAESLYRAVKFDSNDPSRWIKLARAERMQSHGAQAAIAYQRALDLQPDSLEALQALAILNVRGGQYDLAKRFTNTLLTLSPDDPGGWIAKGAIALFEHRLDEALAAADHLIQIAPSVSDGAILKARVLDAAGRTDEAVALLRQRLTLDSNNSEVAAQALTLYQKLGDRTGIQEMSLALARLRPDDPRYQLEAVRAYRARGLNDQAEETLTMLADRFPNNVQVQEAVAWQVRDHQPADVAIARIEAMAGKAGATARAALARILVSLGAPAKALALTVTPPGAVSRDTVDLHSARAAALLAVGRKAEAMTEANAVLSFDWADTSALLTRAQINWAEKKYPDALSDAQQVFSADKSNVEAALLIARVYADVGNDLLAARAFGTAQDTFPDNARVNAERVAWMLKRGHADDAAQIALAFARNVNTPPAWRVAGEACRKAADQFCIEQTRAHLERS